MRDLTPLQMQYLICSMNQEAEEMEDRQKEHEKGIRRGKTPNVGKADKRSQLKKKIKQRGQ